MKSNEIALHEPVPCVQASDVSSLAEAVKINLSKDTVPLFLCQAYEATLEHDSHAALAQLTPQALASLESLEPGQVDWVSSYLVLGCIWQRLGNLNGAAEAFEKVKTYSSSPAVLFELVSVYRLLNRYSDSLACCEALLPLLGHFPEIQWKHAEALMSVGHFVEGLAIMESQISSGQATAELHASYLWYLRYVPGLSGERFRSAHEDWAQRYLAGLPRRQRWDNTPDSRRRLRIGYLSSDFRTHSVVYTLEPVLTGLDPAAFEVFGYGRVAHPDATTERLKRAFHHYRDVWGMEPEAVARLIATDGIDLLVVIGAHGSTACMRVLAYKPAPVQVDIDFFGTAGLSQIDHRIVDSIAVSPEMQSHYTEPITSIDGGNLLYRPPTECPPVKALPARSRGHVTFGAFGSPLKINEQVSAVWGAILQQVPGSCLLIKCFGGRDVAVRQHLLDQFERHGVASDRVCVKGWLPAYEHWDLYNQLDIALDTFPFNGCVTTLEALWMGVPVVTVIGNTAPARMCWSTLSRVGLAHLGGRDEAQMVAKAVALAGNLDVLERLRRNLRTALWQSPLCDYRRVSTEYEVLYRRFWQQWCTHQKEQGNV